MGELLPKQRAEAARLGWMAVLGWAGGGAAFFLVHSLLLTLVAAGVASWLTWRWFMFRAKWGMRF